MEADKDYIDYKDVQHSIAEYIRENGIKQSFISKKTGYAQPKISKCFSGTQEMTLSEFLTVCFVLNIKPT